MADMRAVLRRVTVAQVMLTAFKTLAPDEPLFNAIELVQHGGQHEFPVTSDGHPIGMLTRDHLLHALSKRGPQSSVGDAMERDIEIVDPRAMLDEVFSRLEARQFSAAPVVHDGRLIGLLTANAVAEFLAIQAALDHTPARVGPTR